MIEALVVLCAASCLALLASRYAENSFGVRLFKTQASLAFVALGVACGGLGTTYGTLVLVGLVLSFLGDVLLIPREQPKIFLAGIGSFLAAHVAYSLAFLENGVSTDALTGLAAVAVPLVLLSVVWLRPYLSGTFAIAVPVYTSVITVMVVLAGASAAATDRWDMLGGALAFAISDVAVARERFVAPGFRNAAWGLPLYYGAQIVLALSIRGG